MIWAIPLAAGAIYFGLRLLFVAVTPESEPEWRVPAASTPAPPAPTIADLARTPVPAAPTATEVYYGSCAEARAAGKAPIRRGQPGYRTGLDRDGDGVACDT